MTRASLVGVLERNWHVATLAGMLVGAFGYKVVSPDQRIAAVETTGRTLNYRVDSVVVRLDRIETAITILALKACKDTSVSGFEALTLQCATLGRR